MIRIQTYNSAPRRIQAGGINPGNQPALRTVSGRAEDRTLAAMLQSGLKLTDIAVKEYVQNETTRVEQSLADMNTELAAERERYMRENQGQNALNAGEHFEQFARNLRDKTLAGGKFQGRFADIFMKQASGLGFNFTEQGRSYARQQRGAWYDSVKKSMVSEIMNLAAQDYDDPDKIAYQLESYKFYLDTIQHGLDNRGELNKVFQNVAETRVDGYLAHNRIADARDAFEESRDMLGDRANTVKVRIDARAEALQARAEARRKKAEQDAEEARIESGYNDVMSGISELPSLLSAEERKAKLVQLTADMEPKLRAAVRKRGEADIDERELVRKAGIVEELGMVDRMRKANPQASGNEMIRMIRESSLSDDAKAAGIRELEREREGAGGRELSAAGLREFRAVYDARNGDMSDTEMRALVFDLNLNAKDRESALAYSGRGMEYSQARIDGLIGNVLGRDTGDTTKSEIYAALMKRIPAGESWDDRRIRAEIYNLAQQERGRFGSQSLAGRVLAGEGGRFRPDIPEAMRGSLNSELERSYPFFSSLPEKARQLMRQGIWLRRQYGITPEWTEEERKLLEGAGDE